TALTVTASSPSSKNRTNRALANDRARHAQPRGLQIPQTSSQWPQRRWPQPHPPYGLRMDNRLGFLGFLRHVLDLDSKAEGRIECLGRGPGAKWRRKGII